MKKKIVLLSILLPIFMLLLCGGLYFLFKDKIPVLNTVKIEKYTEILDWCESSKSEEGLVINCPALLVDIRVGEENTSCFDIQILTKNNTIEDLSLCERTDKISYANEILQFKRLLPIDVEFSYSRPNLLSSYVFNTFDMTLMSDDQIKAFVNDDIAELVNMDITTTKIKNSVDFCPAPDKLPEYITETNKTSYTGFYEANKLEASEYENTYNYNLDDTVIRFLFSCDSKKIVNNLSGCTQTSYQLSEDAYTELRKTPNSIDFDMALNDNDRYNIKIASFLIDNPDGIKISSSVSALITLLKELNGTPDVNEYLYCSAYKVISKIEDSLAQEYSNVMLDNIEQSIHKTTSAICAGMVSSDDVDNIGLYLRIINSTKGDDFQILNKCNILNLISQK